MKLKQICLGLISILMFMISGYCFAEKSVLLGVERSELYEGLLKGKRVGLFTNQTGMDRMLRHTADILRERFNLTAIFVPEHGLYGAVTAGENFADSFYKGIKVYSLYGDTRRPTSEMLEQIDIICVDIQDIGIRHYTYFSSLAYIMEETAKLGKEVLIFDRPNPLGGKMEGPILKPEWSSFIGLYQLPLRHGLTIGEFAGYINAEQKLNCRLHIIPLANWRRHMYWKDTKLFWVMTSPLIPTADTAYMYGVTGVAGDTNLSVGVGTSKPFYFVGAPFVEGEKFKDELTKLGLKGVAFRTAAFEPKYGTYSGKVVHGVEIYLTDVKRVNLPELGYLLVHTVRKMYPDKLEFPLRGYGAQGYKTDAALGEDSMSAGKAPEEIFHRWREEAADFQDKVQPFLLYK